MVLFHRTYLGKHWAGKLGPCSINSMEIKVAQAERHCGSFCHRHLHLHEQGWVPWGPALWRSTFGESVMTLGNTPRSKGRVYRMPFSLTCRHRCSSNYKGYCLGISLLPVAAHYSPLHSLTKIPQDSGSSPASLQHVGPASQSVFHTFPPGQGPHCCSRNAPSSSLPQPRKQPHDYEAGWGVTGRWRVGPPPLTLPLGRTYWNCCYQAAKRSMGSVLSLATQLSILGPSSEIWQFPHGMAQHSLTALSVAFPHVAYGICQWPWFLTLGNRYSGTVIVSVLDKSVFDLGWTPYWWYCHPPWTSIPLSIHF